MLGSKLSISVTAGLLALTPTLFAAPQVKGGGGTTPPGSGLGPAVERITFEGIAPGTILSQVFSTTGSGPVGVSGLNPDLGTTNAAVIFDSANPTGEDEDLGTPNEDFGGPGIGEDGGVGSEYENRIPLKKVLIVAEDLVDANGDGLVDDPDDADTVGSRLEFDFTAVGPIQPLGINIVDVEAEEPNAVVELLDGAKQVLATVVLPAVGDNGAGRFPLGNTSGVFFVRVRLNGSGAIDNLLFRVENTGSIGDTVFCDLDDDGVQDPGEPGIANVVVDLTCAGPDGQLGTSDDLTDSTTTNDDGFYLFTDLPPDLCKVEVDVTSAPPDKVPGRCPTEYTIALGVGEAFLDADFCFITPGEIGDFVWCDLDLDSQFDPGEPGIPDVGIILTCAGPDDTFGTSDDYTDSTVTNADGFYLFTGVPPGLCRVEVDLTTVPDGKVPGDDCPTELDVTLGVGESFLDADFCFNDPPGEIGDFVWCDEDDDGVQDPGEPGIADVIVNLTCAGIDGQLGTSDDLKRSETTGPDGFYLFTEVPVGECVVMVDVSSAPDDKVPGKCPLDVLVDLGPGESFLDADFCFITPPPGVIGDFVWCDLNDDGVADPGEPGIADVLVNLTCAGPDGQFDTSDDFVDQAITNQDGFYLFDPVAADLCRVEVDVASVPPPKIPGQCPTTVFVDLQPGESFLDADFCFVDPPGVIGDTVYCDEDNDGVQDMDEPGIPGAAIELRCAGPDGQFGTSDDLVENAVTNNDGMYLFTDVPAGMCRVTVDPASVVDKIPGRCPLEVEVDLAPGEVFLDADFCFVTPGEIGDLVWCDIDGDGERDFFEPGIPDIEVRLTCAGPDGILGTSDDITDSTLTGPDGSYLFTNVPPGPCSVEVDSSIPPDKELGDCPDEYVVNLQPGQSFLDADFCYVFPPMSCCEFGKPEALTFIYTGQDCSATKTDQDTDKYSCSGDPAFEGLVFIRATDDDDPFKADPKVWFEGLVELGHDFTLEAAMAGDDHFPSNTYIHAFDASGQTVLQTVNFHTSCSQPLNRGDQYGAFFLAGCRGEDEPEEGDCCEPEKPRVITLLYTGEDCSATKTQQGPDKHSCDGDPAFAPTVYVVSSDKDDPFDTGAKLWFQGFVDIGTTFDIATSFSNEDKFASNTWVHILDTDGTTVLQTVKFHTSCSQPLFVGDQYGSMVIVGCSVDDGGSGSSDSCDDGKPQVLTFQYTGQDCSFTSHTQDSGKVSCSGDPAFAQEVFIRSTDKEGPNDMSGRTWFEGQVFLDGTFDVDAKTAGETRLENATFIHIFDATGNTLLQTVEFHTSCSQTLAIGNQFGASLLVGYTPEP